jgi:hypothetical protein
LRSRIPNRILLPSERATNPHSIAIHNPLEIFEFENRTQSAKPATQIESDLRTQSSKQEYFNFVPDTIGNSGPELAKYGARRPTANSQKPAVGGPFLD